MWMNRNDRAVAGPAQRPSEAQRPPAEHLKRMGGGMQSRWWLTFVFVALCSLPAAGADIYRWSDDKGTVHFGNRPPADARDIRVVFKEIPSEAPAGPPAMEDQGQSAEAVIQEFEEERRRGEERMRKQSEDVNRTAPPTREDVIAREKERLEKKIVELEQMPLEQFGSQRNKRVQIGFYEYRLQDLMKDPEAYFKNPVSFEGNVPSPEKRSSD